MYNAFCLLLSFLTSAHIGKLIRALKNSYKIKKNKPNIAKIPSSLEGEDVQKILVTNCKGLYGDLEHCSIGYNELLISMS